MRKERKTEKLWGNEKERSSPLGLVEAAHQQKKQGFQYSQQHVLKAFLLSQLLNLQFPQDSRHKPLDNKRTFSNSSFNPVLFYQIVIPLKVPLTTL